MKAGELSGLLESIDRTGWVPAARPGFPLSATIPPTYWARFTTSSLIDGDGVISTLRVASFDPRSGGPAARTWLTIDLYPASSESGRVIIKEPGGGVADAVTVQGGNIARMTVKLWSGIGARTPALTVSYQGRLADGRYVIVSGGSTRPLKPEDVRALLGIVSTLGVR